MDDWQTMETAPKDGTIIDLWCVSEITERARRDAKYMAEQLARPNFTEKHSERHTDARWLDSGEREGWYSFDQDDQLVRADNLDAHNPYWRHYPTHWRPLPPPPQPDQRNTTTTPTAIDTAANHPTTL